MKKLQDYQEILERYKKFYPANCEGKNDIEILLFRKLITENEAFLMTNPRPNIHKKTIKKAKVKTITEKQYQKLMKEFHDGAQESIIDLNYGRPDGKGLTIEDIAYDLADSFLFSHPEIHDYLGKQGVERSFHKESIADYAV